MPRRKRKQKTVKVPPTIPTNGVWIKAYMDENGGVAWNGNIGSTQQTSNLYGVLQQVFRAFGLRVHKEGNMTSQQRTREFKGAMGATLGAFNSRSHRRRFGVWFEIHTAPIDRAYVAWKLTQGGQ